MWEDEEITVWSWIGLAIMAAASLVMVGCVLWMFIA